MYERFYGFSRRPFSILPEPDFLYPSRQHRLGLDLLRYALSSRAMFTVVSGEIGTGKTTLVRYLLRQLEANVRIGMIANAHSSFGELLPWIMAAFHLEHRDRGRIEMLHLLNALLARESQLRRTVVLVIDEAQNLAPDALEELRLLSNVNVDGVSMLQIVLVGQPGLRDTLRRPDLRQLAQRVTVDYDLKALSAVETAEYIAHRVSVAGRSEGALFEADACEAIHRTSGGVPRVVNLVCDLALVYAFADQKAAVDAETVAALVADKRDAGGWLFEGAGGEGEAPRPEPGAARIRALP